MKLRWTILSVIAISVAISGPVTAKASAAPLGHVAPSVAQDHDDHNWDAPPGEFREIQRQGFHDGIEGARKDFDNHRAPNVNNRDEYRHPHVSPSARDDYREGFRRGYDVAMHHLMGEPR
ncbi:MAG: hypothetical protein WBQ94_08165 [Terracidiphilus sp.]